MPPKKKFKVKNPGNPIIISKAPKKKKILVLKKPKKLVGTLKPKDIFTNKALYRAEENVKETMDYADWDWIKGITTKDMEFYRKHQRNFNSLSEKKQNRIEKIEEKVRDNLTPSLEKLMLKDIKDWIKSNKDKEMSLSQARKNWEDTYF